MFFVPYNMINFFFSKSVKANTGNYRHVNSQRIYLYLLHFKSGRTKDIKELSTYFSASKQSILKSLNWLVDNNLLTINEGWYTATGKVKFHTMYGNDNRKANYRFNESDLKNKKLFQAKIFKYLAQDLAEIDYSRKSKKNKNSKNVIVIKKDEGSSNRMVQTNNLIHCTQTQSYSYLSKAVNRSERTIQNRLNQITKSNYRFKINPKLVLSTEEAIVKCESRCKSVLTDKGFAHEVLGIYGTLEARGSREETQSLLKDWRIKDSELVKLAYVQRQSKGSGTFLIVKRFPNQYTFTKDSKLETSMQILKKASKEKTSEISKRSDS